LCNEFIKLIGFSLRIQKNAIPVKAGIPKKTLSVFARKRWSQRSKVAKKKI
jgi:hypothetical protein